MAARNALEQNEGTAPRAADRENGDQATKTRRLGQDEERSRSVENVPSDQTVPEQVYADYALNYSEDEPRSRRRAGSGPAPSRGLSWARNEGSILL